MNALALEIRREIERTGPITFARFMEMALYAPGLGYYERPREIGRRGDFFTSVSTGPLFGQLLAFQFAEWLETKCPAWKIQLVEAGAHDGRLAADILDWLCHQRSHLIPRLEYCIIEPSLTRRRWQEETLNSHLSHLNWFSDISNLGDRQLNGVIFSNEFFDALPVHRLAWNGKTQQWREWHVTVADETFAWELSTVQSPDLFHVPSELARVLPDGFTMEVCPAAADWWRTAARALRTGKLLTIDYGFSADSWLCPDRPQGTLRAFARHHASRNLLADPGEQDLTAHVNFSALEEAGRAAGLGAGVLVRQSKFLTEIFAKIQAKPGAFAHWDQKTLKQFQTLTHPEHLGYAFQVLTQEPSILVHPVNI